MRKVLFKKWIKSEWKDVETGETVFSQQNPGFKVDSTRWTFIKSGYWQKDFITEGTFHSWGFESQDSGEQMVMDSVGIIELEDGTIELVPPQKIKFSKK